MDAPLSTPPAPACSPAQSPLASPTQGARAGTGVIEAYRIARRHLGPHGAWLLATGRRDAACTAETATTRGEPMLGWLLAMDALEKFGAGRI